MFDFYGYKTENLGIEFRALGDDKLNYKKWVQFIEYMHEKQIYIFFVVDNENKAKQVKVAFKNSFTKKKRLNNHPLLKKQLNPARIIIWGEKKKYQSDFEEANFTDTDISKAFLRQKINISVAEIKSARQDNSRKKGLIEFIKGNFNNSKFIKPKLEIDLVDILIEKRIKNGIPKNKTPLEKFVLKAGEMISLNHQPTGKDHQKMNFKTGFMG